jgi:hypothetical protein
MHFLSDLPEMLRHGQRCRPRAGAHVQDSTGGKALGPGQGLRNGGGQMRRIPSNPSETSDRKDDSVIDTAPLADATWLPCALSDCCRSSWCEAAVGAAI